MDIDSIFSEPKTYSVAEMANQNAKPGSSRLEQQALGQDEFFKLLTTQLASQDPLKPMEDTAFIAQMASFSQLEMTNRMATSMDDFTSKQEFQTAQQYLGKTVSTFSDGRTITGVVASVERANGATKVFLEGDNVGYEVNHISRVATTKIDGE